MKKDLALSGIAVLSALLPLCQADQALRRKRAAVLAMDDLVDSNLATLKDADAWGRDLKGSKKGKKESKSEMSDDGHSYDSEDEASSDDKKSSKKEGKKTARSAKKGKKSKAGKREKSSKRDKKRHAKKGKQLIDNFMAGLGMDFDFSMSMSMSMSMPSAPSPSMPTTPAPQAPTDAPQAPTDPPAPVATPAPVTSDPTLSPTLSPQTVCESLPREEAIEAILVQITDGPILTNPATPQGMAYRWLVNDDPLQIDPCTYPTVEQRYALATLYFGTEGAGWVDSTSWLSVAGECDWFGITCAGGMATSIELGTLR